MLEFHEEIKGAFDSISNEVDRLNIQRIVSNFHMRDGKPYDDGSFGTIYISPAQLRDLLAWVRGGGWDEN